MQKTLLLGAFLLISILFSSCSNDEFQQPNEDLTVDQIMKMRSGQDAEDYLLEVMEKPENYGFILNETNRDFKIYQKGNEYLSIPKEWNSRTISKIKASTRSNKSAGKRQPPIHYTLNSEEYIGGGSNSFVYYLDSVYSFSAGFDILQVRAEHIAAYSAYGSPFGASGGYYKGTNIKLLTERGYGAQEELYDYTTVTPTYDLLMGW